MLHNQHHMTTADENNGALCRLKSIFYDAASVSKMLMVSNCDMEIVANLRAGKWYCSDPSVKTCYFKSTDGHNGHWDFNTRRLNIGILETLLSGNPVVIVDATANRRKIYPDALSKTIPIWAHVLNSYISKITSCIIHPIEFPRFLNEPEKTNLHEFVSHKCPEWIHDLNTTLDESIKNRIADLLKNKGIKQIVPIWVSAMDPFNPIQYEFIREQNYTPLICLSVGTHDPVCMENQFDRSFNKYVLGAGDDEEMWSMGLTPEMFWKDPNHYLSSQNDAELKQKIARVGEPDSRNALFINDRIAILRRHDAAETRVSVRIITKSASFYRNIGVFNLKSKWCLEPLFPKINGTIHQLKQLHGLQKIELFCNNFKVAVAIAVSIFVQFGCELNGPNETGKKQSISKEYVRKIISFVHYYSKEYQLPRGFCQQLNRFYISLPPPAN